MLRVRARGEDGRRDLVRRGRTARRSRRSCSPALKAARLASRHDLGFLAKRCSIQSRVGSTGRVYIQESSPRAKKFFDRSASRGLAPGLLGRLDASARSSAPRRRVKPSSEPSVERVGGVAGLVQVALVEGVAVDDERAAGLQVARLALRAAGFIATSTSGASPGVRMSWSEMWTWKRGDAGQRARPGPGSRPGSRAGWPGRCRTGALTLGEPVAGELHAVAGVAGEADDDPVEACAPPAGSSGFGRQGTRLGSDRVASG